MEDERMNEDETQETSKASTVDYVKEKLRELLENNQADFSAWTLLITEVERNTSNDIQKICLVYDSFLSEFPLCYGYWKKYAGHKARLCTFKEVEEVYERAVKAATYSVDLWVCYCTFGELLYEDPGDVRRLYERGLSFVGKDYLCHLLWDKYIEFEYSQKQWSHLAQIYINILRFPTKKLHSYYERFKKLVAIWEEEMGCHGSAETPSDAVPSCDMEDIKACGFIEISNVIRGLDQQDDLCRPTIVKKYISVGDLLYQQSSLIDGKISFFESRIRRPYFHVKSLDDWQIENWHQYLDFVETQGDFDWTVKLYERCLIPCANYSEFWIRYVKSVEARGGREIANYAITRGLTVFLKKVPAFHIFSATFKEQIGDATGARSSFLQCSTNLASDFIENISREANLEKRMGNTESACMIYEKAIEMATEKQNKEVLSVLYTRFARFTFAVTGSIDDAREVFIKGIQQIPCKSIIEGLIHFLTMHGGAGQLPKLCSIVANAISQGSDVSQALTSPDRETISKLFLEFVDLYGTIHEVRMAWDRHWRLFPHIMRPHPTSTNSAAAATTTTHLNTVTENTPLDKSMEGRNGMLGSLTHKAGGDTGHDGVDMDVMDNVSLKNNAPSQSEGAMACRLEPEEHNRTKGLEEQVEVAEVVRNQSTPEGTELLLGVGESVHESHGVVRISEATSEYSETENRVQPHPDQEFVTYLRPPALDDLSIHSPQRETQQSNPITSDCLAQEVTSNVGEDKVKDGDDSDEVSENHASDPVQIKSGPSSQGNLKKDNNPLCQIGDPMAPDAGINPQIQMHVQEHTNLLQDLPVDGAYSQNASNGGNCTQMHYGGLSPSDPSFRFHGHVDGSQTQQWQIPGQLQYPATATNSQMLIAHGYPCQPQAWTNSRDQQANQTQGQYPITSALQLHPSGSLASPGQNMQQQVFVYAQSQPSTQLPSPSQVYQQSMQSNGQYGYFQGSQGIQPHIWHYYQQQLYQQQQNQQLYNQPVQQLQIEHLQQLQQKLTQQHQSQNQLSLNQLQLQQPNQQQLNLQEQPQLSPQQEQNHHRQQQQHQPQFQQQNQQVGHTEQQQNLLYLQQQIYLQQQQQQLYLQQQQQMHLLQQHQQQQLLQEHQQLSLQQQQQVLHQQQQEQHQQQISALEPNTLDNNFYLQQTLPIQQHSIIQHGDDYGQQVVAFQGEGTKLQNTEQSGTSDPSNLMKALPN